MRRYALTSILPVLLLLSAACATRSALPNPSPVEEDAILTSTIRAMSTRITNGIEVREELPPANPHARMGFVGSWDRARLAAIANAAGVQVNRADLRVGATACAAGEWVPGEKDAGCPAAIAVNVAWVSRPNIEARTATVVVHVLFSSAAKTTQGRRQTMLVKLNQDGSAWRVVETRLVTAS